MLAITTAFGDSYHAPTISLKLVHFHGDFGHFFSAMTEVLSRHTSSLTSGPPTIFRAISVIFPTNLHILANPFQNKPVSRLATQIILKTNKNVQIFSTMLTMTQGIKFER